MTNVYSMFIGRSVMVLLDKAEAIRYADEHVKKQPMDIVHVYEYVVGVLTLNPRVIYTASKENRTSPSSGA